MRIIDYYLNMQQNSLWYDKFHSTSNRKSGKIFSYINTNFRSLSAFLKQFDLFSNVIGIDRSNWSRMDSGQELDKHRVTNLLNAGFIVESESIYSYTAKGIALKDLLDLNYNSIDSWFILFLLILDHKNENRNFDLLKTVNEFYNAFAEINISKKYINCKIIESLDVENKEELIQTDIFWFSTFYKDLSFISLYKENSQMDRDTLKRYVIDQFQVKNSNDLIAHKYKPGGCYLFLTMLDDLKTIYFADMVNSYRHLDFNDFVICLIDEYCFRFPLSNKNLLLKFIYDHKSIFNKIHKIVKGGEY